MEKSHSFWTAPAIGTAALLLLLTLYAGSYYVMVVPIGGTDQAWRFVDSMDPAKSSFDPLADAFFSPILAVDRRVRASRWGLPP